MKLPHLANLTDPTELVARQEIEDQEKTKIYLEHLSLSTKKGGTMWGVCVIMISTHMGLDVEVPAGTSYLDHNLNLEKKIIKEYPEYFL